MRAVGEYIVIDKIKTGVTKVGGLELTESQNKDIRYLRGEVISIGDKVPGLVIGDIVRYDKHAGHGVDIDDKMYHVIRVTDIVIVE